MVYLERGVPYFTFVVINAVLVKKKDRERKTPELIQGTNIGNKT